jgi:hypothetical protein
MQLLTQPNRWSCLATAFAMVLDISYEELIKQVGHDGSEVWFPRMGEPSRRRSFHIQELVDAAWKRGFAVTEIEVSPIVGRAYDSQIRPLDLGSRARIERYMQGTRGVLGVVSGMGRRHALAWDGKEIFDPTGIKSDSRILDGWDIEYYWILTARC